MTVKNTYPLPLILQVSVDSHQKQSTTVPIRLRNSDGDSLNCRDRTGPQRYLPSPKDQGG